MWSDDRMYASLDQLSQVCVRAALNSSNNIQKGRKQAWSSSVHVLASGTWKDADRKPCTVNVLKVGALTKIQRNIWHFDKQTSSSTSWAERIADRALQFSTPIPTGTNDCSGNIRWFILCARNARSTGSVEFSDIQLQLALKWGCFILGHFSAVFQCKVSYFYFYIVWIMSQLCCAQCVLHTTEAAEAVLTCPRKQFCFDALK